MNNEKNRWNEVKQIKTKFLFVDSEKFQPISYRTHFFNYSSFIIEWMIRADRHQLKAINKCMYSWRWRVENVCTCGRAAKWTVQNSPIDGALAVQTNLSGVPPKK